MTEHIVVVGASLAGLRAVESARRAGFDGSITLVGAEEYLPYDRPPLSKAFLVAEEAPATPQPFRTHDQFIELGVQVRLGTRAVGLDDRSRSVVLDSGDELPFTRAVLATGAQVRRLRLATDEPRVRYLRTFDDAVALRGVLDTARRILVIGAGFIGSEVASAAMARGCGVILIDAAPWPLERALGPEMGLACVALHSHAGVDVRLGVSLSSIESGTDALRVRLSTGDVVNVDVVVVGVGAEPATAWLEGSGVRLDNGIVCDESLESSVPDVFAAGDVARWCDASTGRTTRLENWTAAAEQGQLAGRRAAGAPAEPYRPVPYFWSDWHATRIQMLGTSDDAEVDVLDGSVEDARWIAGYRRGDRLVGLLAVGMPSETMKYRPMVASGACWDQVLDFAARRRRERRPAAAR